jgi:hypothetical protein
MGVAVASHGLAVLVVTAARAHGVVDIILGIAVIPQTAPLVWRVRMLDVGGTGEDRTVALKRPRNKRDWEILAMASSVNREGEHTLRESIVAREKAASWLA